MSLIRWVADMLRRHDPPTEATEARVLSARISREADRLNEHLSQYKKARDPFAAIMADFYNRDQVERIWHGLRRD